MMPRLLRLVAIALLVVTTGCATPPPRPASPEFLFADALFSPPQETVGRDQMFALTEEMRRFAHEHIVAQMRRHGVQGALFEALYRRELLKLEYESSMTRTAAQAFEARAGNCLSLVVLTAAFAKELGIPVRYHSAYLEESWSRKGDFLLRSGHINVTLDARLGEERINPLVRGLTIDFLPPEDIGRLPKREISEPQVVAMFMNNRAVEALVRERIDDAYAWAREAVRAEPGFLAAHNTLGVVYLRRGALPEADAVFRHVLRQDPEHTRAIGNLAEVLHRQGRTAESAQLRAQLARLEPEPPLHFFNLGLAAMKREDFRSARDLFAREATRGEATAEVHFWLGVAHHRLGNTEQATRELARAADASTSRGERELYSAKLDALRASSVR